MDPSRGLLHHPVRNVSSGRPAFQICLLGCLLKFLSKLELSLDLFIVRSQFLAEHVGFSLTALGHVPEYV